MSTHNLLSLLLMFSILIATFEFLYWVITRWLGIVLSIPKAETCGIFWLISLIVTFVTAQNFPDLRMMICGVIVYALHATYCTSFSLSRTRKTTGNPVQNIKPTNKLPAVLQQWTEDEFDEKKKRDAINRWLNRWLNEQKDLKREENIH